MSKYTKNNEKNKFFKSRITFNIYIIQSITRSNITTKTKLWFNKKKLNKFKQDINTGINYDIYRKGIHQVFLQSEVLAQRIFHSIDSKITGKKLKITNKYEIFYKIK